MHATTPKGNIGYDQYTVPNDCSCRTYFCCFPLALANICPWPLVPFFQILWRTGQTKPPTIPFGIVACTFSDNLSQNSCIHYCPQPYTSLKQAQELQDFLNVFSLIRIDYLLRFYAYLESLELARTLIFPKFLKNMEIPI